MRNDKKYYIKNYYDNCLVEVLKYPSFKSLDKAIKEGLNTLSMDDSFINNYRKYKKIRKSDEFSILCIDGFNVVEVFNFNQNIATQDLNKYIKSIQTNN